MLEIFSSSFRQIKSIWLVVVRDTKLVLTMLDFAGVKYRYLANTFFLAGS